VGTTRAFVAVELPESDRERIDAVARKLSRHRARVSWVRASNLHLTLAFLGDVDESKIGGVGDAVARAASDCEPFELAIAGAGGFPSLTRPRVLWVGMTGGLDALALLHERVWDALERLGFARDAKRFSPHVTIGRVRDARDPSIAPVARELEAADLAGEPFTVREVTLMRSELDPRGARYSPLARATLGAHE
jgi:2'-5' RNA ligase